MEDDSFLAGREPELLNFSHVGPSFPGLCKSI